MSIPGLITEGIGPGGSVLYVLTGGLDIGAAPLVLIDYDTGQKTKKANKARDQALKEGRERNERHRQQVIDAFESAIEGKPVIDTMVAQEIVNIIQSRSSVDNIPTPNFQSAIDSLAKIQSIWSEYLEKDDEEVLVLL